MLPGDDRRPTADKESARSLPSCLHSSPPHNHQQPPTTPQSFLPNGTRNRPTRRRKKTEEGLAKRPTDHQRVSWPAAYLQERRAGTPCSAIIPSTLRAVGLAQGQESASEDELHCQPRNSILGTLKERTRSGSVDRQPRTTKPTLILPANSSSPLRSLASQLLNST